MRSLREFAQFVGKPGPPVSTRALADYLRLAINPSSVSVREMIQALEGPLGPVGFHEASVEPKSAVVPFTVQIQPTKTSGYVFGIDWIVWKNGGHVKTYNQRLDRSKPGGGLMLVHPVTEPATYSFDGFVHGIGKDGFAKAKKSFTVVAKPKPEPPPPPPPRISVDYDGPAAEAEFTVTGSGFVPNHAVHIRVVNNSNLVTVFFDTTSASNGAIDHQLNFPCVPGITLSFSANDERNDPNDVTGTLWSNTVTLTVT